MILDRQLFLRLQLICHRVRCHHDEDVSHKCTWGFMLSCLLFSDFNETLWKFSSIKFYENLCSGSRVVLCRRDETEQFDLPVILRTRLQIASSVFCQQQRPITARCILRYFMLFIPCIVVISSLYYITLSAAILCCFKHWLNYFKYSLLFTENAHETEVGLICTCFVDKPACFGLYTTMIRAVTMCACEKYGFFVVVWQLKG